MNNQIQSDPAKISVIVPVYNGASTLGRCLQALQAQAGEGMEIIVVNDRSTDESAGIARQMGVEVIENVRSKGPAGARNAGAEKARGQILLFVDSDVVVRENTVAKVLNIFDKNPQTAALFGSYDTEPAAPNFLSQYKNLLHHFVHQMSGEEATTFWAGCGAIRKEIFRAIGGFNEKEYPHASIEDIELGFRLWRSHHSIRLEKSLQVKHLKRWTFFGLLKADVLYRAVPWSKLILQSGVMPRDLNLKGSQRMSAALVDLVVLMILLAIPAFCGLTALRVPPLLLCLMSVLALTGVVLLNRRLYRFFIQHLGWARLFPAIGWHLFYYVYSTITFVFCWLYFKLRPGSQSWAPLENTQTAGLR